MNIYQKSINTARILSATSISVSGSGHTGSSVGAATIMFTLFKDHLMFNPMDPTFENRDRFVLSAGHLAPLYYSVMHMFDYAISANDLKNLRKYNSKTPGHPEIFTTPGVEVSTGPLGQGVANAVGLAIAQKYQGEKFNTINMQLFNNYTYCLVGDGCLMEGVAQEAISLAGNLKLNKLILLYDQNNITIDGQLNTSNSENVELKFKSQNWNVIKVNNGNNYKQISRAIAKAKKSDQKPTIIICKTVIGYGTEYENTPQIHGKALNKEELQNYKKHFLDDTQDFEIPEDVHNFCKSTYAKNIQVYERWRENFFLFEKTYPELFKLYQAFVLPKKPNFGKLGKQLIKDGNISGRDANNAILNELVLKNLPIMCGTADLGSSVRVVINNSPYFSYKNYFGRNIKFGVREHAMGAVCNGISLYSSIIPFCSTFLSFSNYLFPAIRMGALMNLPVNYFFTHDGLLVGEDGPTHQPVEQISQLRRFPNISVYRPGTVGELLACHDLAFNNTCPQIFILSKSNMFDCSNNVSNAKRGMYVLESEAIKPVVAIYSSGIDLKLASEVRKALSAQGFATNLISCPCLNVFDTQSQNYKNSILKQSSKLNVVIECTNDDVWYKYFGDNMLLINNQKFGKSGKGKTVYEKAGFNSKDIVKKILEKISKRTNKNK